MREEGSATHAADGLVTKPHPGYPVLYVSKIDNGPGNDVVSPAVVLRTRATTVPEVIDRWGPEPRTVHSESDPEVTHETTARPEGVPTVLPDDYTVDLLVHGLGRDYREYGVPHGRERGCWHYDDAPAELGKP